MCFHCMLACTKCFAMLFVNGTLLAGISDMLYEAEFIFSPCPHSLLLLFLPAAFQTTFHARR